MTTHIADRLRKINEHREALVKHLAPCGSDYGFGGAHRLWVKECAVLTADEYIRRSEAFVKSAGNLPVSLMTHIAIPMPPSWNGVRPAECEEYGHPHLASKDWRHFENTLRWRFAEKGWLSTQTSINEYKEIAFVADKMINVARMPFADIKAEDIEGKTPNDTAVFPEMSYEAWCEKLDSEMAGTPIAEQRAVLENVPFALRPMVAMSFCGGDKPEPTNEDPQ
jgi:hypothetical protein